MAVQCQQCRGLRRPSVGLFSDPPLFPLAFCSVFLCVCVIVAVRVKGRVECVECKESLVNRLFQYDRASMEFSERIHTVQNHTDLCPPFADFSHNFPCTLLGLTAERLYGLGNRPTCFIFTVIIQFSE